MNEIKKTHTTYELVGTLYLGPEAVPQNETQVKLNDKIFNIEEVIPVDKRSEEYKQMMVTLPEKRKSSCIFSQSYPYLNTCKEIPIYCILNHILIGMCNIICTLFIRVHLFHSY